MAKPKGYVSSEYLQMVAESVRHLKKRTYELMQIKPGQHLLDVGCGPASDTIELGKLVGPEGRVVGVDHDQAMVDEADNRAREAGAGGWVQHQRADSGALPFQSNTFDSSRSERLFQHLLDPAPTVAEMVRVTKSGGRLVLLDTDWGSNSTDTREIDVERRLARVHADMAANNGYAGRQLYRLLIQRGLVDVRVEISANWSTSYAFVREATLLSEVERIAVETGIVTKEEVQRLRLDMERADAEGVFFACVNQMIVVGTKP